MVAAETDGRAGKAEDGKARTREVKMAVAFTQTRLDAEGRPVRDPASSSYLATFAPAAGFGILTAAEARRRGAGRIRQLTVLGDGAPWIWNLAACHFPAATQIVDLYHAREHVRELANLAGRLLAGHRDEWLAERLAELDNGDIPALLSARRTLKFTGSLARERDKALHYFQVNAHRMHYARYRSLGLFVGSGVVEAGCRSVVCQRCKLSGMRWTETEPPAFSPCAARKPATAGTKPGPCPAATPTPPDRHLSKQPTQKTQARESYRPVTYIRVPHPGKSVRSAGVGRSR